MSREALVAHIERKREEATRELAEYREIEERIRDEESSYFGYVTLRWGIAQAEAWIAVGGRDPRGAGVRVALAVLIAALVAVPAAGGYRNPTPGKAVVLQKPGMHRAKKLRRERRLPALAAPRMDVYRPRNARGRLPAVLLGGPPGSGRTSGQKVGWAQLIAASGLSAVAFDIRSDGRLQSPRNPALDVQSAIAYVRSHSKRLGIDPSRLCTLGFSAPWHLWATMRDPRPWLRCNVVYYEPLDFQSAALGDEFSALTYLRRSPGSIPPMLVLKAGRDATAGINESIDRFEGAASELHADVRVATDPEGAHGFDVGPRTGARRRSFARRCATCRRDWPRRCGSSSRARPPRSVPRRCGFSPPTTRRSRVSSSGAARAGSCWPTGRAATSASGFRMRGTLPRAATGCSCTTRARGSGVDLDRAAAVEALRRTGSEHVIAMGSSMGAIASLIGSASLPSAPAAVVSLSAPASFGPLNALQAVPRLQAPTFFGASEQDDRSWATLGLSTQLRFSSTSGSTSCPARRTARRCSRSGVPGAASSFYRPPH